MKIKKEKFKGPSKVPLSATHPYLLSLAQAVNFKNNIKNLKAILHYNIKVRKNNFELNSVYTNVLKFKS